MLCGVNNMTCYYKQINRANGELLGYVTYDDYIPDNNNEVIYLEEISQEEFISVAINESVAEEL